MEVTRVLIVDDDAMVRTGLRMVLSADPTIQVVGEATNGQEALDLTRNDPVDVVMMDLQMPVMDGVTATRQLRRRPDPPAVLILTTFHLDHYVLEALAGGALGYLLKETAPQEIARAVHMAAAGDSVFSAQVTERLVSHISSRESDPQTHEARRRLARLTERELEVAEGIAAGSSNASIAADMFMSEATVKTHVSRILSKTAAENRVQVALLVYQARRTS
ncbi:response regulator [Micromonospora sp. NPDC002575]|uniref:response regulator n=1 Tax=Micromonospora sp. NPDC002575 TaxID=3364222 RepID=UPI00369111F3